MEIATWYANPDRARTIPYVVSARALEGRLKQIHAGQAAPDQDHQTVGRDWRARPEKPDRQ